MLLTGCGAGWLAMALPGKGAATKASSVYLLGETTHGHHQIEMSCKTCHLPDGGVTDQSCIGCHGADLKKSRDTHPKHKFIDPTKAVLLEQIDASNCLTCHTEHQEERTHAMGVTVPLDYCIHCHQDVAKDRPSHREFAFNSCANAGCHNYHDNTALYENFLKKHYNQPDLLDSRVAPLRRVQQWLAEEAATQEFRLLTAGESDAPHEHNYPAVAADWAASAHALIGVNCTGCHDANVVDEATGPATDRPEPGDMAFSSGDWVSTPDHTSCKRCHESQVTGFLNGKHGMRLAVGLSEMTPELARRPMHAGAAHKRLNCSACHDPHRPDLQFAAVDSCVSCHDDGHTRGYLNSSHYQLWQDEISGTAAAGTGVSCATCHMPRDEDGRVEHNQNSNLQPNEKMIRTTCMNCHGLQFTLDALADPELKATGYSTSPQTHVESPQMVHEWFESKRKQK